MRHHRPVLAALALAGAMTLLVACGGQEPTPSSSGAAATHAGFALPAIDVVRVDDGSAYPLATLAGGERPLLFWFWAPH